jgi:hypothetical protein
MIRRWNRIMFQLNFPKYSFQIIFTLSLDLDEHPLSS